MGEHDGRYRLFFSHPRMVQDLLRGFLHDEWVDGLDLSTLERVSGSFVRRRGLRQRHGDMVWRARTGKPDEEWLYLYFLLEFQSAPDPFMPVRLMSYVSGLLEDLVRRGELAPGRRLPPVLPIVLYRGRRPWRAPLDLRSLFASVPDSMRDRLPQLSYELIDEHRLSPEELEHPSSLTASLFRIETTRSPQDLPRLAAPLAKLLRREKDRELRSAFEDFLVESLQEKLPGVTIPESVQLEEIPMLEENLRLWRERTIREGLREGRREGRQTGQIEGMRQILLGLMEQRFGRLPADIRKRVRAISSADELNRLAKRVLTAQTLVEMGLEP